MRPIKEVKYNNLRRLFYEHEHEHPITYKAFAEMLEERADVMGKYLAGRIEIPDDKIVRWCGITDKPFSFFYNDRPTPPWPPQKKSYRMMPLHERLALAAEDYVEYTPKARKMERITAFLRLVSEELERVVPDEYLSQSPILTHFLESLDLP